MTDDLANRPEPLHGARGATALRLDFSARNALRLTLSGGAVMFLAAASCGEPETSVYSVPGSGTGSNGGGPTAGSGGAGLSMGGAKSAMSGSSGAKNSGGVPFRSTTAGSSAFGTAGGGSSSTPPLASAGASADPFGASTGGGFGTGGAFATGGVPGSFATGGFASGIGGGGTSSIGTGGAASSGTGGAASAVTGGSGGAAGSTMLGECTPGMQRCDVSGRIAQNCSTEGRWQDTRCQFVCSNNVCGGECAPGARQCDGSQPERCTDQGTWMADGSACPAQCENGACTGACKNGATQCDSSDTLQTCNDGQWGPSMSCKFACVQNKCDGVCSPGDTQCANGTERQTCGQTGQWGDKKPCDFVCTGNKCDGECRPNERKCKNATQEQTCNDDGQWQDGAICDHVCTNKACGGDCDPGETRCKSSSQVEVCSDQGKWQTSTCPDGACVGDACATCQPGALDCTSNREYVECNAQGEWGTAKKTCSKNACVEDKCDGVCIPGAQDTKCDHSSGAKQATRVCGDQGTWENVTCSSNLSCVKGKCGSFPKTIFITQDNVRPVGGLAGLDDECQESADAGGLSGTFKAFIIDSKTDVFKRFSMEGGPFKTPSGTTVALNWDQLINGDLQNLINEHEYLGLDIPPAVPNPTGICSGATTLVWGNIMKGGGIVAAEAIDNCNNFTTSAGGRGYFGDYSSKTKWRYSCGAADGCNTRAHLICIEQ